MPDHRLYHEKENIIIGGIMNNRIDARGLSCPQPVVLTRDRMNETKTGQIEIIVDNQAACDNITRIAKKNGWEVNSVNEKEDIVLSLTKS